MERINGRPVVPHSAIDKFKTNSRKSGEADKPTGGAESVSARNPQTTDKVEISDAAHNLMELRQAVDTGRAALQALPDVRSEKVEQAKKRLAQGYYNSVEVQEQLADKLDKVIEEMDKL